MGRQEFMLPKADGPGIAKGKDKLPAEGSKKLPAAGSKRTVREGSNSTKKKKDPSSYKVAEPSLDRYKSDDNDDRPDWMKRFHCTWVIETSSDDEEDSQFK